MKQLLFSLLSLGLLAPGCKSDQEAAADALPQVAKAAAESPEAQARAAAWKRATTKPPPLAAGRALNLGPALHQLLPAEGYLQVESVRAAAPAEPAVLQLPILWRPTKGNYPAVAPGYRLPFEAVLKWHPQGYGPGEKVPSTMALTGPWAPDTLHSFSLRKPGPAIPEQMASTTIQMKPGQAVTVRGVLYAYTTTPAGGQAPSLVLYPYQNPLDPPDARKMVYLPL